MHVAVNTRLLQTDKLDGIGWFSHEVLSRLVKACPEHQFTFIFDRPYDKHFIYNENVKGIYRYLPTRHPILYQAYFEYLLPFTLRQINADLFFSPDGFLSTRTSIPQIPVIHDLNFEHRPDDLPKAYSKYYRSYFPKYAKIASKIITVSSFSKDDISKTYGIEPSKIFVAHNGCNERFKALSEAEKQISRNRFAEGSRYFIFVGSFSKRKNVHNVIRAFDKFRHGGHNAKLVLVGNPLWKYPEMEAALRSSKFGDDIKWTGRLSMEELPAAMGGAEALLFPSYFEGFGIPIMEAFNAEVPVITSQNSSLTEVAGEAALYAEPDDFEKISEQMMQIFMSENQRIRLIQAGKLQRRTFSWDNTANKVKDVLFNTVISK